MLLTHHKLSDLTWTVPLVATVVMGLLVVFYAVVSSAAKAAELHHQAVAAHTAALIRCNALAGRSAMQNCRKILEANDRRLTADAPVLLAAQ